ncbi:MAG TPA: hypothetical protein VM425_14725 [Myxococcota bacterium]|nr:hypothetical protein [Myxococcota bacterium]
MKKGLGNIALAVCLAAGSFACSGSGGSPGPSGDTITLTGKIFLVSSDGSGIEPADEASVKAVLDVNGNRRIDDGESATASASAEGAYSIKAPAKVGMTTVVTFQEEGYASVIKTVAVGALKDVSLDVTLMEMGSLTCENKRCRDDGGVVSIGGVDAAFGYAQVFNPLTDADKFPGSFEDSQGKMLVSAVFASFDLRDENDQPITSLPAGDKATLSMRVPRDSWSVIVDIMPGDDRISVPMYYFDEIAGQWEQEGSGWLQDSSDQLVPESKIDAIHSGAFTGDLLAVAEVTHFSYWNVDWPQEDNTCVSGIVVDADGKPVSGAGGTMRGINFAGYSPPIITADDGSFCVDMRRSEKPGEDLDGNGTTGETLSILTTFKSDSKSYRFDPLDVTTESGSCPTGCMQLGTFELVPAHEIQPELCTLLGKVYRDGSPIESVQVFAEDDLLDPDVAETLCAGNCEYGVVSGADGGFQITGAFESMLSVSSYSTFSDGVATIFFEARRTFLDCPSLPVDLNLEVSFCQVGLPAIGYDAGSGQISWDPAVPAESLMVFDGSGSAWQIYSESGFTPPVIYGQLPAGAQQVMPLSGSPAAIGSGDLIFIVPKGGFIDYQGYACYSSASFEVP